MLEDNKNLAQKSELSHVCFGAMVEAGRVAEVTFFEMEAWSGSISICQDKGLVAEQLGCNLKSPESP